MNILSSSESVFETSVSRSSTLREVGLAFGSWCGQKLGCSAAVYDEHRRRGVKHEAHRKEKARTRTAALRVWLSIAQGCSHAGARGNEIDAGFSSYGHVVTLHRWA